MRRPKRSCFSAVYACVACAAKKRIRKSAAPRRVIDMNRSVLALAVALTVSACGDRSPAPEEKLAQKAEPTADALAIDASRLPGLIRFSTDDLDKNKDPCVDFYGYVNQRWLTDNPIPGDRSDWGPTAVMEERSLAVQQQIAERAAADDDATGVEKIVADFWATGMDEAKANAAGLEPIEDELAEIDAIENPDGLVAFLRTAAARGETFVFGFGPEADFKDSSTTIAFATQGGLGLPDKSYYVDMDKRDKLDAYETHVAKVLELAGASQEDAAKRAHAVIAFEKRLADASLSREQISRDISLYYNPVSPADADRLAPHFSWTQFFESQGIAVPAMFSFAMPDFHHEVDTMIAEVPVADWQSYLRFHAIDGASPYLSDDFVQEFYGFYGKTMQGQQETPARWKRVLDSIEGNAAEAMGQLYVKVAFPPESKARMEALVGNLSTALKARIENLDWMSEETKQKALAKWATFTPRIGYPDKWRDWSGLETDRDSYLANVTAARAFNYQWEIDKIGKPVDKSEWGMSPQTVNASYSPLRNQLTFPAAILQPPLFDPEADEVMNYGAIGAVIGHEMTHGYDDQGSRFGPTGNLENWWTPTDAKLFAARTDKLVEQFNEYEALPGLNVNGKLTLGENIADLGGLATAYDAMKEATAGTPDPMIDGLTRDQRFFLSFGTVWRQQLTDDFTKVIVASNPHAPGKFRAIGTPANLPAFAVAFSCKEGDPMARMGDEQVVIW
jgi:putative endopeptidase